MEKEKMHAGFENGGGEYVHLHERVLLDIMMMAETRFPQLNRVFGAKPEDVPDYLLKIEQLGQVGDFFQPVAKDEEPGQLVGVMAALCEAVRAEALGADTPIGTYSQEVAAMNRQIVDQ
ncbi:hypothetical protein [Mesorhizobium sp.]|uniref:hypothetical protein n=1 Tax=Mesorhizobium sp. TaxID=1871066 RepID=UPI00121AC39D|nr:hypothetical protein [Mesorhizobium sp.]TIV59230.1 MAG: hypothetical protein E5V80_14985 [Mesorhizobium sp.]